MAGWYSLGVVTVAASGTPARITANRTAGGADALKGSPTDRLDCYSILVQQVSTNTGLVVVGRSDVKWGTPPTNPLATLAIPTVNALQSATAGEVIQSQTRYNAADYFVDVSVSGEKAAISILTDDV